MKSELQLKVQAYLDNELSTAEARKVGSWINSDPAARDLFNELKETKELVAQNELQSVLSDSRDFYWSKIQRGIAQAEREPERAARPWWLRFMAPVAGAVAIFALLLTVVDRGGKPMTLSQTGLSIGAPLQEVEQSPEVSTITFRSEAEGVTVVWLSTQ